jgi:hypothetical protein
MLISVFTQHLKLGITHIININGLDHVLFIIVMIAVYTYRDIKKIFLIVTSFTIAHSLTLLLSLIEIVKVSANWVEAIIPLTIMFTCIENMFLNKLHDYRVLLSGIFGLVHGLGFSNSFQEIYNTEFSLIQHLLPFNVGIELGQLVIVIVVLVVQWAGIKYVSIKTVQWKNVLSFSVLCVSTYWFVMRCNNLI